MKTFRLTLTAFAVMMMCSTVAMAQSSGAPPLPTGPFQSVDDCVEKVMQANFIGHQDRLGAAQDAYKPIPKVSEQTCYGSLFQGLNIFSGGLGLGDLLRRLEGQVCSAGRSMIQAAYSSLSGCGVYASGYGGNMPGFGFGQVCQQLYLGGGGGDVYSLSSSSGGRGGYGWNNRRYDWPSTSGAAGGTWSDPSAPESRSRGIR